MIEAIGKNLWILLTVIIPGLFTYGTWRLLLILYPSQIINYQSLKDIDESGLITTSVITSIALLQQLVGVSVEFVLSLIAKLKKRSWKSFYSLFCERFELAHKGLLNENSTRIIGNCFLSINIFVGLIFLLIYFTLFESLTLNHWVPKVLILFLTINLITITFRISNALCIIEKCKGKKEEKNEIRPEDN